MRPSPLSRRSCSVTFLSIALAASLISLPISGDAAAVQPLVQNASKTPRPIAPGEMVEGVAVVGATDSVPVELYFEGIRTTGPTSVHVVFVIDDSGSMSWNDPDQKRYEAIETLIDTFSPTRNNLDRVAVITFGDGAVIRQGWRTWSDTRSTVQDLMSSSPHGLTPMAEAIELAIDLLTQTDGVYRLAVLLTDGLPEPDDDLHPQTDYILHTLCPLAFQNRILASTIYLSDLSAPDNPLLVDFLRCTDYLTEENIGAFPEYYFRIQNVNDIVDAYTGLIKTLQSRLVAQDVTFREFVNDRLVIDPTVSVTFSGTGFNETQNVLSGSLPDAYNAFRTSGDFAVHLNELDGDAALRFAVKLELDTITDSELAAGYVSIDVDKPEQPGVTYLIPEGAGAAEVFLPMPQATIKFMLGTRVTKSLSEDGKVEIEISNLNPEPIAWFQMAEYPSSFFDARDIEDDLDFHPLEMLIRNVFSGWYMANSVPAGQLPSSRTAQEALRRAIGDHLIESNSPLLERQAIIDRRLCRFWFVEAPPESQNPFWNTPHQQGVYKLSKNLAPRENRHLSFKLHPASGLRQYGSLVSLSAPADATETKINLPMSKYQSSTMQDWRRITPNPSVYQLPTYEPQPDLFVRTCFSDGDRPRLKMLFEGAPAVDQWALLDSQDIAITPSGGAGGRAPGLDVTVKVHNGGTRASMGTVRVTSYVLPLTGREYDPPYAVTSAWVASGSKEFDPIGPRESTVVTVTTDSFAVLGARHHAPPSTPFAQVRKAIVITTTDIEADAGERLIGNNTAVEITQITFEH